MADPMSGPVPRCPWCSEPLPPEPREQCPSCEATLTASAGADVQLPGVTTIDAEAILRARSEVSRPRNRLLSFITGDDGDEHGGPQAAASLAPPSEAVRREMVRIQLAAELAELESEAAALEAQARLAGDRAADASAPEPDGAEDDATGEETDAIDPGAETGAGDRTAS